MYEGRGPLTLKLPEGRLRRLPRHRIFPAEAEAGKGEPAAIYRPDHSDRGRDGVLLLAETLLGTNLISG